MKYSSLFSLLLSLIILACNTIKFSHSTNDEFLYRQAITNAMSPNAQKVYSGLTAINGENNRLIRKKINGEQYILTVSWKNDTTYYKPGESGFYNTGDFEIWVTVAPQLQEFMKTVKTTDRNLRLKQLLGLPPSSQYKYFIEFWVKPSDLFRPCPDREVTDEECSLCFPAEAGSLHKVWINRNRITRYYNCNLNEKYPWTQLGYTYDWSKRNKKHVGLSEFVIEKNRNIVINRIYTTDEYLNSGKN